MIPVLAGSHRITQRIDAPGDGLDAVGLMIEATRAALPAGLAERVGTIAVPRGMWHCTDPARRIAQAIGATSARTLVAEVGVLQHSLIAAACEGIAAGRIDAAIVAGGEARYRHVLSGRAGVEVFEDPGPEQPPDGILRPEGEVVSTYDLDRGVVLPAVQYALMGSAYAHAAGWSDHEYTGRLGTLWAHFAGVASRDEHAWDRSAPTADDIITPSDTNRMIAAPFTKLLCSQWNVDQAASLVFTSLETARELGLDEDGFVFPVTSAESNAMIPMWQRADIHRWPAFRLTAKAARELSAIPLDDIDAMEIYSCFPSAVLVQLNEMGIARDRELTVTGGMTFGGGPLNNFVLQATAAMAERIRAGDASTGMVTGVSGLLTKPGVAVWASSPPPGRFHAIDVTEASYAATLTHPMATDERGAATVVGVTTAPRTIAVLEQPNGSRLVASSDDAVRVGDVVTIVGEGAFRA